MAAAVPLLEQGRFGYLKPKDVARLAEAYRFSEAAHAGQIRQSGDPYISHPMAVAEILADWRLDGQTLMAALLHDVTEDTKVTKDEISDTFGKPVAELVDGVSKLDKIEFQSAADAQAENFRKMLLAMARDVRVILIKLADRLHNMRTLGAVPPAKRRRVARETMEIYAPIANRLGLNTLYHELQELSFMHLYPLRYSVLAKATKAARGNRREMIGRTLEAIKRRLADGGIRATVHGREKHVYSTYRKMIEKHLSFSEVHDIFGARVIVKTVPDCCWISSSDCSHRCVCFCSSESLSVSSLYSQCEATPDSASRCICSVRICTSTGTP
jgi:GTP pyrophosphokinase